MVKNTMNQKRDKLGRFTTKKPSILQKTKTYKGKYPLIKILAVGIICLSSYILYINLIAIFK
jgi:hypothetical protein